MPDHGFRLHGALVREMTNAMQDAAIEVMRTFNDKGELPPRKEMREIMVKVLKEINRFPIGWFVPDDYATARKRSTQ